jgi:7-cyano-7-deazaguanine tRNA-ribosyltransferase
VTARPRGTVHFYPVLHLMTGPPGLSRNGGIWKQLKARLRTVSRPPRLMVQALHFASYGLSDRAWKSWFDPWYGVPRVQAELDATFGPGRDLFMDSGGFQMLRAPDIDLSRWGMEVNREDIFELQRKFSPSRIASLDSPLATSAAGADLRRLTTFSLENAAWLAERDLGGAKGPVPVPYLVIHGRNPREIRRYLRRLEARLSRHTLRGGGCSLALGSQVPLSGSPRLVIENALTLLRWMDTTCSESAALHVFGVGDAIAGAIHRAMPSGRELSFDNSTYVQSAFRLRIFDPRTVRYSAFNPTSPVACGCGACRELNAMGSEFVSEVMSAPAYTPFYRNDVQVNRSDIMALVALHNLSGWRRRVALSKPRTYAPASPKREPAAQPSRSDYEFPLKGFEPVGAHLLLLPCSKHRPYRDSPSHRRIVGQLNAKGYRHEGDFDRITLSGFFGPVHWNDESLAPVMAYDYRLTPVADRDHVRELRYRTASVLNVIHDRYDSIVAYLRSPSYGAVFGDVVRSFGGTVASDVDEVGLALANS